MFIPRHIVVTGASGGIGHALALAYAVPGVVLGLTGRDAQRLEATAQACRAQGASVETGLLDVLDGVAMAQWLDGFDTAHPIDLLIANAGVASTIRSTGDWEDFERTKHVVDTNFYGALNTALPVIERMKARGQGQVALIASLAALHGLAISPAYCASKSALRAWGESVRPILARQGIQLALVFPGFVQTAMSDVFPGGKPGIWTAERAAAHIRARLARGQWEIAFPRLLAFGTRLLSLLPPRLADWILQKLSFGAR